MIYHNTVMHTHTPEHDGATGYQWRSCHIRHGDTEIVVDPAECPVCCVEKAERELEEARARLSAIEPLLQAVRLWRFASHVPIMQEEINEAEEAMHDACNGLPDFPFVPAHAAGEERCPRCGAELTPAGEGLPPMICEECGWPQREEER
jgi:hypothetical protein